MSLRNKLKPFTPSEHRTQSQVCAYLDVCARSTPLYYFAIPNGGLRNIRVATQLKAEGARAGSPDLCIMLSEGRTIWLEMKKAKGRMSPPQKEFQATCERLGHQYQVAYSFDDAVRILETYGVSARSKLFQTDHLKTLSTTKQPEKVT